MLVVERAFRISFFLALAVHLLSLSYFNSSISNDIDYPEYRELHLKFGEHALVEPPANIPNSDSVVTETILSEDVNLPLTMPEPSSSSEPSETNSDTLKEVAWHTPEKAPVPAQRRAPVQQPVPQPMVTPHMPQQTMGTELGNTVEKDAEMLERYTQIISASIARFMEYPKEALVHCTKGEKPIIYMEIKRDGTLYQYGLERRTGVPILDHAVLEAVAKASPFPAIPEDYAKGEALLAFRILNIDFVFDSAFQEYCK